MKKAKGPLREQESMPQVVAVPQDESMPLVVAVCPTCGQPLPGDPIGDLVRVPDAPESLDPTGPPASGLHPEAPSDEEIQWALSPPLTPQKREFLLAATQTVPVKKKDRFGSKEAELAAVEAMWPPRKPSEGPGES